MFEMLLSKGVRRGLAVAFGFLLLLSFAGTAHAAHTYEVNSIADSDGVCDPQPTQKECTLRQAINAANADPNSTITFNISGSGTHTIQPKALPAITAAVTIDGYTQQGSAVATTSNGKLIPAVLMIELDGSGAGLGVSGLVIKAVGTTVKGLVINRFQVSSGGCLGFPVVGGNGIEISASFTDIEGNYIGTDVNGTKAMGNSCTGISITGFGGNIIGGDPNSPQLAQRNVISGNGGFGVSIVKGADGNFVVGNFIGTDATGSIQPLANARGGLGVASSNNIIGGTSGTWGPNPATPSDANNPAAAGGSCTGACNLISGNSGNGVVIFGLSIYGGGNQVLGNFIGTDVAGAKPLSNGTGVQVVGSNNTIGGSTPGSRNLISGNSPNGGSGIELQGNNNAVQGNFIGTDTNGKSKLPNSFGGIWVSGSGNEIGGTTGTKFGGPCSGACNLISGNGFDGVSIEGSNSNVVVGNFIGPDVNGQSLANLQLGVRLAMGAKKNSIGGVADGGNVIAFNGSNGVEVDDGGSTSNSISRNSIFSNAKLGIELLETDGSSAGVTLNDPLDTDTGGNGLQNFPVLAPFKAKTIKGTLNSTKGTQFTVEFFSSPQCNLSGYGEGKTWLGSQPVITSSSTDDGSVGFSFDLPDTFKNGDAITATATGPEGTSEFSKCLTLGPLVVNSTDDDKRCDAEKCTLRGAINVANVEADTTTINFNIPACYKLSVCTIKPASAMDSIDYPVLIDGYTQPGSIANTLPITGGSNAVLTIELDGTNVGPPAVLQVTKNAGGSKIRGLVINRGGTANNAATAGIQLESDGNKVAGNFIGTNVVGFSSVVGNLGSGVVILGGKNNIVGGTDAADHNVISGNQKHGVEIISPDGSNNVWGNFIGTAPGGFSAAGNGGSGVRIANGTSNTVGGADLAHGNLISANKNHGVEIVTPSGTNTIAGNSIGTSLFAAGKLPNSGDGVQISGSNGNTVGGGNFISANSGRGVAILGGATMNKVSSNFIGLGYPNSFLFGTPTQGIGNGSDGVQISGSNGNTVGGLNTADKNVISANGGHGVAILAGATGTNIWGNVIGTDKSGFSYSALDLGNAQNGVYIESVNNSNNIVGKDKAGNTIAFNANGVVVKSGSGNTILDNSIFANKALGIDLGGSGITDNDPIGQFDNDSGANGLQNYPVLSFVTVNGKVGGTLRSAAKNPFRVQFFSNTVCGAFEHGQGENFLDYIDVTTDGNGMADLNPPFDNLKSISGNFVTATATDLNTGDTSEFSACHPVGFITVYSANDSDNTFYCGDQCSLRDAITESNKEPGKETVRFKITDKPCPHTIPLQSALPAIIDPVIIDGYTDKEAKPNTLSNDIDATLCIQVTGSTAWNGLEIDAGGGGSTVQGLAINKFASAVFIYGSSGNTIRGNFIGTDPSGLNAGNNNRGIYLSGSSNNVIGVSDDDIKNGTAPAARNLISGNSNGEGVAIVGTSNGNRVRGNFIGTNRHGTTALPNSPNAGVLINDSANNVVGGTSSEFRNVISGNGADGVVILNANATGNLVQGNLIGTDVNNQIALPNKYVGVHFEDGSSGNTIGDSLAGAGGTPGNVIASNSGGGVVIEIYSPASVNNAFLGNSIHDNTGLGINLISAGQVLFGVTFNDPGDGDDGANHLQNFPVISSSAPVGSQTNIKGTLNSTSSTSFRLDFFANSACDPSGYGQGNTFLGYTTVKTDGSGNATFDVTFPVTVPIGQFLTATATDPNGNTSEFSKCAAYPDGDGDGIADNVDTKPTLFSTDFDDTGLSGTTTGTITKRGDRDWAINDEPNNQNTSENDGVRIIVGPGSQQAQVQGNGLCTAGGKIVMTVDIPSDGDNFVLSCGSSIVRVQAGSAKANAKLDALMVSVDVPANGGVRFNLTDDKGGILVTNIGAKLLSVTSAGTSFSLAVGQSQPFYDKTPPEASIQFDPAAKDIVVIGRESQSGVPAGPVAAAPVVPTSWGNGDDKDGGGKAELRTYKVKDLAGNTLVLVEKVKKEGKEIKATLVSLQYNDAPLKTPTANQQSFEWSTDKDGSIQELNQKLELGSGPNKQTVEAKFDAKKNQTVIDKAVRPGLVLIHLDTNQGALAIGSDSLQAKLVDVSSAAQFQLASAGISMSTSGRADAPVVAGYGRIQAAAGSVTPAGLAILGLRQGGVLVSEASVPASPLIQSGRIYAEINGAINTGVAIANPNDQDAVVAFYFTDAKGQNFGNGSTVIPANGEIARYLNEPPFNGGSSVTGTFTFTSSVPVGAIALRGLTNERSEFLMTTLPVAPLGAVPGQSVFFPDFTDGGGWTTEIVLVNPTDDVLNGSAQFFGTGTATAAAQPATVSVGNQTGSTFRYSIPARSSVRLATSGRRSLIQAGSVRVTPAANSSAPSGLVIFSSRSADGVTITEAGAPAIPASSAFRVYAEASGTFGQPGSIQAGVAVANASSSPVPVTFALSLLDGTPTGLTSTVLVPGNGHTALFLNQIPGFGSLSLPFQGVLRISTNSAPGISVVGLRGRYNERNEFLITTIPPVDEASPTSTAELIFPHLADGGGFTTQFVLFSPTQPSTGTLRFFSQLAQPLSLTVRESP